MSRPLTRFASRYALPLILLVVLGGLALRASDLRADPPPDLSWSTGPYTDEALNTYSARNMVLYGKWKMDDFYPFVVYPLVNYVMVLVFKLFGMGFVQVKLLSLICGVLSVLVLYLLVREDSGPVAGLIAGLALATSFPLVMYSRLGLTESVQILFLLLTALFFVKGLKRPRYLGVSGLCAAASVLLVKLSAAFVAPAFVIAFAWEWFSTRKDPSRARYLLRAGAWALAGIGAALGVWFLAVFLPHRAEYFQYVLRHSLESPAGHPQGLAAYLLNTFTVGFRSRLIPRLVWVAWLGFLALPVLANGRKPGLRFLALCFVLALLMLGYMNYRPDRYELVLIPAFIAAFASALGRILETGTLLPPLKPGLARSALYAVWLWPLVTQLAFYTNGFWGAVKPSTESGLVTTTAIIALAVGAACYAVVRLARNGLAIKPVIGRAILALILLGLSTRLDLAQYSAWFSNRTHTMVTFGQELDKALPDNAVLVGNWSSALLIGSKKRVVPITDWANSDDPIGRFGATHLVSAENGMDIKLFEKLYPDLMPQATVFSKTEIRGIPLTVYQLPPR